MTKVNSYLKNNILYYVIVFIIILLSNKTLLFGTNEVELYSMIGTYASNIILFVISLCLLIKRGKSFSQSEVRMLIIFSACLLFSGIVNYNLRIGYGFMVMMIFTGLMLSKVISFWKFSRIFEDIILVITVYSLVIYATAIFNVGVLSRFPTIVNTNNYLFINCWLCCIPISMQFEIPRLFGPFSEPGIYQIYLNLAILFHCLRSSEISILRIIILLLALVLTFSTTGYIACGIVFVFMFLQTMAKGKSSKKGIFLMCIIVSAMIILSITTDLLSSDGMVFNKFNNSGRTTTAARMGAIWGNIAIWAAHPVFGVGITALPYLFEQYCSQAYGVSTQSNTNSVLVPFAMFGFIYGFLCVRGFLRLSLKSTKGRGKAFLLFISMLLMLAGENITENVLFYILIMYGLTQTIYRTNSEIIHD